MKQKTKSISLSDKFVWRTYHKNVIGAMLVLQVRVVLSPCSTFISLGLVSISGGKHRHSENRHSESKYNISRFSFLV